MNKLNKTIKSVPTRQVTIPMTIKSILMFIVMVLAGCSNLPEQQELSQTHNDFYRDYETDVINFNREINASLVLRKRSIEFFKQENLEGEGQYFSAEDIKRIQTTVKEYAVNRDVLLNSIAYKYRKLIAGVEVTFSETHQSGLYLSNTPQNTTRTNILYVNPNDELGRQYLSVIKLGLAATLTLYDNFIIAIMPYQENGYFRRKINYDNIDNEKIIENISGNFRGLDNYKDTLRIVEFNEKVREWESQQASNKANLNKDNDYFNVLIDGSYTNKRIKEINLWDRLAFRTVRFRRIVRDILFDVGNESMNMVSKIFGNGMGLISTRTGYLKSLPASHKQSIEEAMEPGDILLEKTPFRLTDRFIPGHWGHVAIWVGSKEQLEEIGVWDKLPTLYEKSKVRFDYQGPSFQSQILAGQKIIEALRPGVQINSLEHFLNVDDMAVLRDKKVNKKALQRYVIRAFEQVGKEYDFNFDVETDRKIVCSELAFVAYDDYQWPIAKTAGRYTISPDHVGQKANGEGPFEPVMLYHDGKVIEDDIQVNFNHLMHARYQAVKDDLKPIL